MPGKDCIAVLYIVSFRRLLFLPLCCNFVHKKFDKTNCRLGNRALYEECQIDEQCRGKSGNGGCRKIRHRKLCLCHDGFVEDRESLECRNGKVLFMLNPKTYVKILQGLFIISLNFQPVKR